MRLTTHDEQERWYKRWVQRPAAWAVPVALTALIGAIAAWVVPRYGPALEDELAGDALLRVVARSERLDDQGETWAMSDSIEVSETEAPLNFGEWEPSGSEFRDAQWRQWVANNGGIDVGMSHVKVVVEGVRNDTVLITQMRAHVIRRNRPVDGTLIWAPAEGTLVTVNLGFDLDKPDPIARSVENDFQSFSFKEPYFAGNAVTVAKGEHVVFNIVALAEQYDCAWEIVVEMVVDGEEETMRIRDGSKPFRTSALANKFSMYEVIYAPDWQASRFVRVDPASFCPPGTGRC